ncbi:Rha family transcriptional regulator [Latilactobacillus curvatus]|uniref:Rha family transcriptional regulator n=1 Tax=Latilactobacillus curvatus TaxID=28038 RepID=UPI0024BA81B4|nr:Rha family transcriptional regulator [Latilactobacillus curvatus]WHQ78835.1 Rha family transcriptional regulator [Latilactobacillus curvatus]
MNNLVIMKDQQAVTSSLQVAGVFEKRHDHILRDIESIKEDVPNFGEMFFKGKEPDSYSRERKVYFMNRDGFALLAMGFTGKKALNFKLKYIKAFNQMESEVKSQNKLPSTPQEKLSLLMQNVVEANGRVEEIDTRVSDLENNAPLSPSVYSYLSRRINQRVSEVGKGFGKLTPKQRGALYVDINQGIKAITGVGTRSQLREKHYDQVMEFINDWEPSTATKTIVRQQELELD